MIASCEVFRTMREMSTRFMENLLLHHYFIFLHFHPQFSKHLTCSALFEHRINPIMPVRKKKTTQSKQYKCSLPPSKNILRFRVICLKIQTQKKKEKDLDRSSRPFSGSDFFPCIYRFFKVETRHMLW